MLFGVVVLAITRHAVWSMTAVFVLLNLFTIATSQPPGQIAVCLVLSLIVAGMHALQQYPQVAPAIRQRQWRRFMRIGGAGDGRRAQPRLTQGRRARSLGADWGR